MELELVLRAIREAEGEATNKTELRELLDARARYLKANLTASNAEPIVTALQRGGLRDRQFAALLLREAPIGETLIGELAASLLQIEVNDEVLAELVTTLGFTGDPVHLPALLGLVRHPSGLVRFQLATALPQTGGWRDDVVEALVCLLRDLDEDVRWSAAYELCVCWNEAPDDSLHEMLIRTRDHDPSVDVREIVQLTMNAFDT
jgi:HEAT repeat protein